jgi:hypothetical protein
MNPDPQAVIQSLIFAINHLAQVQVQTRLSTVVLVPYARHRRR